MNIDDLLINTNKTAIIWKNQEYSYSYIYDRFFYWQNKLKPLDIGNVIGLEGDFSPETIALLFVLIEQNKIIVPLDYKNTSKNNIKKEIAVINTLITIDNDDNVKIEKQNNNTTKIILYLKLIEFNKPGLVLFTSGSSGSPKAALHDFEKLLTKFKIKRNPLSTINFLLFDHWGGLNTLFHVLSNQGTVIFLDKRTPEYVCSLIEKYKVELLPTSPTFLKMLLVSRVYNNFSLKSLKIISYGSEPMPESLLIQLNEIFPTIKLQQTYGLIELGVMRSKSESNDSLWVKLGGEGFNTRVVDNILHIKSDSVMLGYLNAPSPFSNDGWFITGDLVELKGDLYKIIGRQSEIINVGGEKVFPQEVENIIMQIDEIEDVLVFSEKNTLVGNIVCAKIKYNGNLSNAEMKKNIKLYCKNKLENFKIPVKIIFVDNSFESNRFKKYRI